LAREDDVTPPSTSRRRFDAFRADLRAGRLPEPPRGRLRDAVPGDRSRGAFELLRELLRLLRGHALPLGFALLALTVSGLTALAVPAAPKFAIDYVLTDSPGPAGIPAQLGLPSDRRTLLVLLGAAMLAVSLLGLAIDVAGRWQLARIAMRLETAFQRRVYRHAVRLPLGRLQALKSGGVASLLRNDAGAPATLLTGMVVSPWRAIVQLLGALVVLLLVDWRLVVGALLLVPVVWWTHRAWIGRIRPVYRGVRQTREAVDAHAAESIGGMRVVRAFGRERTEALRHTVTTHLMARQGLLAWWRSRTVEITWRVLIPAASAGVVVYGGARVLEG